MYQNMQWLVCKQTLISSTELQRTGSVRSSSAFSNHELKADAFLANVRYRSSTWRYWSCRRSRRFLRASASDNRRCHLNMTTQLFDQWQTNMLNYHTTPCLKKGSSDILSSKLSKQSDFHDFWKKLGNHKQICFPTWPNQGFITINHYFVPAIHHPYDRHMAC